jgi:hypothetical protein
MIKNKIKLILLLFFIVLVSSIVFASGKEICDYFIEEKGITAGESSVPSYIPYKNDVINAYTLDGEIIGHIVINNRVVTSIDCELTEKPNFILKVKDLDVVKSINSISSLNNALNNEDIVIEGQSLGKKLKNIFAKLGIRIASIFD